MESHPQNPEFRYNPENFHPRFIIIGLSLPPTPYVYVRSKGFGKSAPMQRFFKKIYHHT